MSQAFADGAVLAAISGTVKVRIRQTPREDELDGVQLAGLRPGMVKDVSASVGSWLVAERYAIPEMRRTAEDDGFSTVKDLRDVASDCPRRRSSDRYFDS